MGSPADELPDGDAHWGNRLREGLQHDIGLVLAKAVLGLGAGRTDHRALVRQGVLFGVRNRDGWGVGLTIATALGNLVPTLPEEERYLALFHGLKRIAADCDGAPPRRARCRRSSLISWTIRRKGQCHERS